LAVREVNELLVEAGATVCGALLEPGWSTSWSCTGPHLLAAARAPVQHPRLESMADRVALDIVDVRAVGRTGALLRRSVSSLWFQVSS